MARSVFLVRGGNNGLKGRISVLQLSAGNIKKVLPENDDAILTVDHAISDLANLRIELAEMFGTGNVIFKEGPVYGLSL